MACQWAGRRVVVTGIGVVTALGHSLEATRQGLACGDSGIGDCGVFAARGFRETKAGEVRGFDARSHFRQTKALKLADRKTRFAVAAAMMALDQADFPPEPSRQERLGVLIGASGSDLEVEDLARAIGPDPEHRTVTSIPDFAERILSGLSPLWLLVNLPNMTSAHVAIQTEARGPNSSLVTDWIAGSQAIGEAVEWIRAGEADAVLAGGADSALLPHAYGSYEQAGFFTDDGRSSRFVPGEGAAVLLLEEREQARRRGACHGGEIVAYATGAGAVTNASSVEENALTRVVESCLRAAGWMAADVGVVVASSALVGKLSEMERSALARVFGTCVPTRIEHASQIGHALGAAGAIDLALALDRHRSAAGAIRMLCVSLGSSGQAAALAVVAGPDGRNGD